MSAGLVLVVEDNQLNRRLVKDVLCHAGYGVLEAESAEEGIALAQEHLPSLVLLDIQLPGGMDGLEAVKVLKHDEKTESIPVVAVTAFAMEDDRERALVAGFDGYLEKPVNIDALRAEVTRFVPLEEVEND
jgi:CheY-like chemotaxis protein